MASIIFSMDGSRGNCGIFASTTTYISPVRPSIVRHFPDILYFVPGFVPAFTFRESVFPYTVVTDTDVSFKKSRNGISTVSRISTFGRLISDKFSFCLFALDVSCFFPNKSPRSNSNPFVSPWIPLNCENISPNHVNWASHDGLRYPALWLLCRVVFIHSNGFPSIDQNWSYFFFFWESHSIWYASLISLKCSSAFLSHLFLSGWYCIASFL